MKLTITDWVVIALYFVFNLAIGLYYRKRATKNMSEFFISGRNAAWWLAGTSMVATTFAADTPLAVTGFVAKNGIAGNWIWWSMAFSGMLTVFFYARLWRRAGVMTDVEFAEIRYNGPAASFLRGFRAIYLGLPINLIILGWVNLAIVKIMQLTLGINKMEALVVCILMMFLTASISTLSGLWGVLVTDLFQFVLKMGMVTVLAILAVKATGGMGPLLQGLHEVNKSRGVNGSVLAFFPDMHSAWMPMITFFVYIAVNWWATWYPGAEPGGGGYIAQRIFSSKDEKNSLLATLWFNIAQYAIRPWPWIIVALVAVVKLQHNPTFLKDPETGYIIIMVRYLPAALRGLMLAAFAAAYMSTIGTQLNWGASYLVNDVYRRFMVKDGEERHYVVISQVVTIILMILSAVVTFYMSSIGNAWKFLIALGAGTGLVYILRWFWWRINAWSEVSAMAAAFVTSLTLEYGFHLDDTQPRQFAYLVLWTVSITSIVWLAVTLMTAPEDKETLLSFYRKVRPNASMWGPIAKLAPEVQTDKDGIYNLVDWLSSVAMVYCFLFGTGYLILEQYALGLGLFVGGFLFGAIIYRDLNHRGWETLGK